MAAPAAKRTVRVTRKQVDMARAEVKAFRAIGRTPDPMVLRIAEAAQAGSRAAEVDAELAGR